MSGTIGITNKHFNMRDIEQGVLEVSTHDDLAQRIMHFVSLIKDETIEEQWKAIDAFIEINDLKSN